MLIPQDKLCLGIFYRTSPFLSGLSIINPQKRICFLEKKKKGYFFCLLAQVNYLIYFPCLIRNKCQRDLGSPKNRYENGPTGDPSCPTLADKDKSSVLLNRLNELIEEICSSAGPFVRL